MEGAGRRAGRLTGVGMDVFTAVTNGVLQVCCDFPDFRQNAVAHHLHAHMLSVVDYNDSMITRVSVGQNAWQAPLTLFLLLLYATAGAIRLALDWPAESC